MTQYQITGSVTQVYPAQSFPSGFVKREFVVTTEEEYPQPLKFEVYKEKCAMLDTLATGARITVKFNIRGSVTKDGQRYFVNLQAWQIEHLDPGAATPGNDEPPIMEPPPAADDEMPF